MKSLIMKKSIFILSFFLISYSFAASPVIKREGIIFRQQITRVTKINIPELNREVVIWRSLVELKNTSNDDVAVNRPSYFGYYYAYLNPMQIEIVQQAVPQYILATAYKNYVVEKVKMLEANQSLLSEKYYATFDNIDLNNEIAAWDMSYIFNR